jgi:hypothetical protein
MWNPGRCFVGVIVVASSIGTAHAQGGQWVNVKAQWCGNTCGEGHDDAACLCEYNQGQSPYSQSSWNTCFGAPCCAWATVFCSVGDPDCSCELADGSSPERMRRWCFPDSPIVICRAPSQAGAYTCSYDCTYETECQINYPSSAANWVYINGTNGQQCTGENETGFWSWAAWRSFLFGTNTCTLSQQSPWDDYPLENEACE